jgi:hypothetical protein
VYYMRINRHAFSPHLRTNRVPFDPHIYCIYHVCVRGRATELIPPLTACSWGSGDASFHQMESSSWATRFLGVLTLDDSLSSTNLGKIRWTRRRVNRWGQRVTDNATTEVGSAHGLSL